MFCCMMSYIAKTHVNNLHTYKIYVNLVTFCRTNKQTRGEIYKKKEDIYLT